MFVRSAREQIHTALSTDNVLSALGFDHRRISDRPPPRQPALRLRWEAEWHTTTTGVLGNLNIDPVGMDERSAAAVLDRVTTVLSAIPPGYGPVRRVTVDPDRSSRFIVLLRGGSTCDRPEKQHRRF